MEEDKNLEQNLDKSNEKLHISDVIGSVDSKIDLVGKKGKELWYPTYAPHIILGTNKSILDEIYLKHPDLRHYR
jgi:hypothetical protein